MRPVTLLGLFADRFENPDAVLVEVPGAAPVTYGGAWERSAQIANALRSAGVVPGDRVAVQIDKSPLAVLLYLACARSGAVLLPLNPALSADEVGHVAGDAEPRVWVHAPGRAPTDGGGRFPVRFTADQYGNGTLSAAADAETATAVGRPPGPDDLAAILYTSGTTGTPKGAMLSQRNLASNGDALQRLWGFGAGDVLLHALPVFHVHGLFVAMNCVLAAGASMVFLPRFDAASVIEHLPRCTVMMGVPTYFARLLAQPAFGPASCRRVRLFVSGSAPLPASTHAAFEARTGHAVLERYGLTETSILTSNPLDGDRRPGTVGPAVPGVEVRVVDAGGRPVGPGEVGGIEARGPNVFGGYWRRPGQAEADTTVDGFFRTGDLGSFDADGYLRIVGRSKDVIICGGENVYPKEVEDVLDAVEGVYESAVVGLADADLGEIVVAVVVSEPGRVLVPAGVREAARQRLAPFKVPRQVHVVTTLPRNAMGKVEKARLRHQLTVPGQD